PDRPTSCSKLRSCTEMVMDSAPSSSCCLKSSCRNPLLGELCFSVMVMVPVGSALRTNVTSPLAPTSADHRSEESAPSMKVPSAKPTISRPLTMTATFLGSYWSAIDHLPSLDPDYPGDAHLVDGARQDGVPVDIRKDPVGPVRRVDVFA